MREERGKNDHQREERMMMMREERTMMMREERMMMRER